MHFRQSCRWPDIGQRLLNSQSPANAYFVQFNRICIILLCPVLAIVAEREKNELMRSETNACHRWKSNRMACDRNGNGVETAMASNEDAMAERNEFCLHSNIENRLQWLFFYSCGRFNQRNRHSFASTFHWHILSSMWRMSANFSQRLRKHQFPLANCYIYVVNSGCFASSLPVNGRANVAIFDSIFVREDRAQKDWINITKSP